MTETKTTTWPLMFKYSGRIFGRGFLASIEFCGRLLATLETEGVWIDGVNPGAFSVGGKSLDDANRELRETLTRIFVGYAGEAQSYEEFASTVERFYNEVDPETFKEWEDALEALKAGMMAVPADLPRKPADWECFFTVRPMSLEQVTPQDNPVCHEERAEDSFLAKAA